MEIWLPVLTAFLGSTGIIGLLTAGNQLSRRARLRRNIEHAKKLLDSVTNGSRAHRALNQAIEVDALRLAAMSIVIHSHRVRLYAWTTVIGVVSGLAIGWWARERGITLTTFGVGVEEMDGSQRGLLVLLIGFFGAYIILGFVTVNIWLQQLRERVVQEQVAASDPLIVVPTKPRRTKRGSESSASTVK